MSENNYDIYIIPPNFIEGGKIFGGMFRLQNAAEAILLGGITSYYVLKMHISVMSKMIVLCLTTLPIVILPLSALKAKAFWNSH